MRSLPMFPGFLPKVLELAGAGLASAIGAFLLSQIVSRPAVPPAAPQTAQLAPADAELIGIARTDQAQLLAELQKVVPETAVRSPAAGAKTASASSKAARAAQPMPLPREPKAVAARPVANPGAKQVAEPLPVQRASIAADADGAPQSTADASSQGGRKGTTSSMLEEIPPWFYLDTDKRASASPRPPMPVGGTGQRAM